MIKDWQASFNIIGDTGNALSSLLGLPFLHVAAHEAGQRHNAIFDSYRDICRVDVRVRKKLCLYDAFDVDIGPHAAPVHPVVALNRTGRRW
jgi:hypothetical protein